MVIFVSITAEKNTYSAVYQYTVRTKVNIFMKKLRL